MSQQPTFHITKEHFVGVINSLHEQFVKDKQRSEAISEIFHTEAGFYDNSALINAIFSFLHEVFPKDEDGHSEIEFYCYTLNFGKNGEEYESPEHLYERLVFNKVHHIDELKWEDLKFALSCDLPTIQYKNFISGCLFDPTIEPEDAVIDNSTDRYLKSEIDKIILKGENAHFPVKDGEISAFNDWASRETKRTASDMYESAKMALNIISGNDCDQNVKTSPDETA